MPTGMEATMPAIDTTSVTSMPPHSRVATIGSPPRDRPRMPITAAMPAKLMRQMISPRSERVRP